MADHQPTVVQSSGEDVPLVTKKLQFKKKTRKKGLKNPAVKLAYEDTEDEPMTPVPIKFKQAKMLIESSDEEKDGRPETGSIKMYSDAEVARIKTAKQIKQSKNVALEERNEILKNTEIEIDDVMMLSSEDEAKEMISAQSLVQPKESERKMIIEDTLYEHELDEADDEVERWESQRIQQAVGDAEVFKINTVKMPRLWESNMEIDEVVETLRRQVEVLAGKLQDKPLLEAEEKLSQNKRDIEELLAGEWGV